MFFVSQATDVLPVTLECRYSGQWFTVKKTEVQSNTGAWVQVYETNTAESQCKKTKVLSSASPGNYKCDVSSLGSHGLGAIVRITYYCWEFGKIFLQKKYLTARQFFVTSVTRCIIRNDVTSVTDESQSLPCSHHQSTRS